VLAPGDQVTKDINPGESHAYTISLAQGDYLNVAIETRVGLTVTLRDPNGDLIRQLDGRRRNADAVAAAAGEYRLGVQAPAGAPAGSYGLLISELRTATPDDRYRAAAASARELSLYRNPKALEALNYWRSLAQQGGHPMDEAEALSAIAHIHRRRGEYSLALSAWTQGLVVVRASGGGSRLAELLSGLAGLHSELGDSRRAAAFSEEALALLPTGDSKMALFARSGTLMGLARAYQHLGRRDKALETYKRALEDTRLFNIPTVMATHMAAIGTAYAELGETRAALNLFAEEVQILRKSFKDGAEALALLRIAELHAAVANRTAATEYLNEALQLFEPIGMRRANSFVLLKIGDVYKLVGDETQALEFYHRALVSWPLEDNPAGDVSIHHALMRYWSARGRYGLAAFHGKQVVNGYQRIRERLRDFDAETQRSYLASKESIYRELADLLIIEGRLLEAQQVLRMLKEQEYFDFIRREGQDPQSVSAQTAFSSTESVLLTRYREIADRVTAIGRERGDLAARKTRSSEDDARLSRLESDLAAAGEAFHAFLRQLAAEFTAAGEDRERLYQLRESQGLMETLRELGEGSVALYTLVGATTYRVIVVTPDVQKAAEVRISSVDLNRRVLAFREMLQDHKSDPRAAAKELYDILVGPIADDLKAAGAKTLMWSLDGVLRYLPISALHDGEKYLVERYRHVVFTPASQTRLKDAPSAKWTGLGLGVTKPHAGFTALPSVQDELSSIIRDERLTRDRGAVLAGKVLFDDAFTEDSMRAELRQRYPVVHIASHFQFHPGNEADSFLLLGDGRRLTLAEVKRAQNLFSGVDLLTLSACDTATGDVGADGKEVEGFGMLAQRQGAKAVVASLWPVADDSTRLLMQEFYRLRNARRLAKVEALRQAQLGLLRKGDYRHPYFWAPFVLIGNWR
jgi:CHAT domain-containing protein